MVEPNGWDGSDRRLTHIPDGGRGQQPATGWKPASIPSEVLRKPRKAEVAAEVADDIQLAERLTKLFAEPWWPALRQRIRDESPAGLRLLVESMREQLAELLRGKELSPAMAAQMAEALDELRTLAEQLGAYIESPAERSARQQRPGTVRLKRSTRPPDETIDSIRSALFAFDRVIGGITKGRVMTVVEDRKRRTSGGYATAASRLPKYSEEDRAEWQRKADAMWNAEPKLSMFEVARRVDPKLAHIIRRYIVRPAHLSAR